MQARIRSYAISGFSCHYSSSSSTRYLLTGSSCSAHFFTERLQIRGRCARPPSARYFVIPHRCRSWSPSNVDSERRHLLRTQQPADARAQQNAPVPHTGSCLPSVSFLAAYNYLTCVCLVVESWLRETTRQRRECSYNNFEPTL